MEWYRWFPTLYNDDTLHLTLEQDAIYRRLIDWYMTNRMPLPCQANAMARICQISLDKWKEHEPDVIKFFRLKGQKYHHKRCDIELDRQDSTSRKLGDAARKAHETRKKNNELSISSMPCHSQANAIPPIEVEERRGEVEDKENVCVRPAGFDMFWKMFPEKNKGERSEALKQYRFIIEHNTATEGEIHEGLRGYLASDQIQRGICARADNWLRRSSWKNRYEPSSGNSGNGHGWNGNANGRRPSAPNYFAITEKLIAEDRKRKPL